VCDSGSHTVRDQVLFSSKTVAVYPSRFVLVAFLIIATIGCLVPFIVAYWRGLKRGDAAIVAIFFLMLVVGLFMICYGFWMAWIATFGMCRDYLCL